MRNALIKYRLILMLLIGVLGCTRDVSNSCLKLIDKDQTSNDSVNFICKDNYPDGKLKSIFYMKDTIRNGLSKTYYHNGKLESTGNWYNGKQRGVFKFYDSLGRINKDIVYVDFKDTDVARPNELIRFDEKGDTLFNESLFYQYLWKSDTIKSGAPYVFRIILMGHLYSRAFVEFNDYDDKYRLLSDSGYSKVTMQNFTITLERISYKIGENVLRGKIVNYEPSIEDSMKIEKSVDVYFSHKFYVIR